MRRGLLAIALAGCAATPAARSTPPQPEERGPFAVAELPARIPARGLTLEGTLAVPRARTRRPAVVLIHGSGPLDRNETMGGQLGVNFGFEVAVFAELSAALARDGYVVIRYDKRTCTRATGCANAYPEASDVSFDAVLEDAQSVIDWVRRQPSVDPSRVFLIGHSLGGAFVPELLTDNPDLRAGVLLAAPYRPIDAISAYQAAYAVGLLQSVDMHPLAIGRRVRDLREIADGTRALREGALHRDYIAGVPTAFWQAWMDLGDALPALLDDLDRPLLAISGAADSNVPPGETILWSLRLEKVRPDPGHRTVVLPCVTHALNCVTEKHVAPALVDHVLQFLARYR